MRKLKKITNRFAAAALAAVMLTAQLPVNAFAAKTGEQAVSGEAAATKEMTAASETADIPESKPSTEVPDPLLLLSSFFMI